MSTVKGNQTRNSMLALVLLLAAGCSSSTTLDEPVDASQADVSQPDASQAEGYDYFGSVEIAQGSTINTTIAKVASSAEIKVVGTPEGVTAEISDADDGSTRLELKVSKDASLGGHAVTFEVDGESEPVSWTVLITER